MWNGAGFLDLIVLPFWPLALSGAAWAIAINALAEPDEISKVVETLTGPARTEDSEKCEARRDLARTAWRRAPGRRSPGRTWAKIRPARNVAHASLQTALTVLLSVGLFTTGAPPAHARRFEFDQRRTEVHFVYKLAYSTQRGRFTKVTGTLDYDDAAPEKTKINASIAAASLTTGEALVDSELKGAGFFNVASAPVIAFRSLAVQSRSATAADVSGELTVNGITKPVALKVSLNPHDDPALKHDAGARKFVATTRIKRSAFNMTDYQSMVDDEIEIEIVAIVRPK